MHHDLHLLNASIEHSHEEFGVKSMRSDNKVQLYDQNSPGPLPKNSPSGTFNHGTDLASYVLDPTVFPHQSNLTAWYPRAKNIMIVAIAVPVSIAACSRSKNEKN